MILSSLCEYYRCLEARGEVTPRGYTPYIAVKHLVCLSPEGEIKEIISLAKTENKRQVIPEFIFPKRSQKSAIGTNVIEHRPEYLFGLECKKGVFTTKDCEKKHEDFVKKNLEFLQDIHSPVIDAYRNFILSWNPEDQKENVELMKIASDYANCYYAFCLYGNPADMLQDDEVVKEKWNRLFAIGDDDGLLSQSVCPVYGKQLPMAELHNKIKGVHGGQMSGCVLVCVNNESEESYGKKKAANGGVSKLAMEQYTEALNYLLHDPSHHKYIDDTTVVFFAMDRRDKTFDDSLGMKYLTTEVFKDGADDDLSQSDSSDIFDDEPNDESQAEEVDKALQRTAEQLSDGVKTNFDYYQTLDDNVEYCIFGLTPNSARLAIRFCFRNTFGQLKANVMRYNNDFAINRLTAAPPLWRICRELLKPTSDGKKAKTDSLSADLAESLLQSIVNGTPFSQKVLETVVRRIKTDSKDINDTRAGLLKACLNRRNKKEELKMALDTENKNTAYLCGRLFAVLEKIQKASAGKDLNRTIKDSYFSSAASTPSAIFPRVIQLGQHHLAKLDGGLPVYYDKLICSIINDIETFPKTLPLEEQGNFIIGYYHQKNFYENKNLTEEN